MIEELLAGAREKNIPIKYKSLKEQIKDLEPDLAKAYIATALTPFNQARLTNYRVNKWSLTKDIAETAQENTTWIRYRLDKLEKKGLIRAKRSFNSNQWSLKEFPGFKEDEDPDFFIPQFSTFIPVNLPLRVFYFPQVPGKPYIVDVEDEKDAYRIMNILKGQHQFMLKHEMIPNCSPTLGIEMFKDEKWVSYWNETEGLNWDELEFMYLGDQDEN